MDSRYNIGNPTKKFMMRVMVGGMRVMQLLMPHVTRALVVQYASHEVIACGLRTKDGEDVHIIYMRQSDRDLHTVHQLHESVQKKISSSSIDDFSEGLVDQSLLTNVSLNDVVIVRAALKKDPQKVFSSPYIKIKSETVYDPGLIDIRINEDNETVFSWASAGQFDPMIYFMLLEDGDGKPIMGAYTRSKSLVYPELRNASLLVGIGDLNVLIKDKEYIVRLLLVDFDGWVSHVAEKRFKNSSRVDI